MITEKMSLETQNSLFAKRCEKCGIHFKAPGKKWCSRCIDAFHRQKNAEKILYDFVEQVGERYAIADLSHLEAGFSSEEAFIHAEVVNACTNPDMVRGVCEGVERPSVCIGVDIGLKHDTSAVAVVRGIDRQTLATVDHAVFVPKTGMTLDLEKTVESILRVYRQTYSIRAVYYDPFQFARSARTLLNEGLPMREYPQTVGNTVAMSETLSGLLNNQTLMLYPDDELRQHLLNCMAKETQRGWRIVKRRESQKIDLAVALAMACQAAQETYLLRSPCGLEIYDGTEDFDPDEHPEIWQEFCTLGW